jgi:hypothetical protein
VLLADAIDKVRRHRRPRSKASGDGRSVGAS